MSNWIKGIDYPEWAGEDYLNTIKGGYLQENETPKQAYQRVAKAAAKHLIHLPISFLEERFFTILWNGWLIPSTPVMANMGSNNGGLPVSCFNSVMDDSMNSIFSKVKEIALMSKYGGGTSLYASNIRPIGSPIRNGKGGKSDGVLPFLKVFDSTIAASKQGETRRGACAIYLDIEHKEIKDFLRINQPVAGELHCHNLQTAVCVSDEFMSSLESNEENRELFKEVIKTRIKRGFPYILWKDTANRNRPQFWNTDKKIISSNLCSEILLPSDSEHSFTCVLSSLNLYKYDEWKDTDTISLATFFLDAVASEFIEKAKDIEGFENAVRFTEKARALGLGVMGFASYLQFKNISYEEITAKSMARIIFSKIKDESDFASRLMGKHLGVPEWCKGTSRRNLTTTAIPPTRSSSQLAGGVSEGIQPIVGNIYANQTAKGTFYQSSQEFIKVLEEYGYNNKEILDSVYEHKGSCQHLDFLPNDIKKVFKTRFEINQLALIELTGVIQEYIEQGISCNLSFLADAPPKFIYECHVSAWKLGLKTLYYLKSESSISVDKINNALREELYSNCVSCEG